MGNDPAIVAARTLFEKSNLTLDELGQKMGHAGDVARKAAWQFLNKTSDPRISTLRRFAAAMGISLEELIAEKKPGRSKPPPPRSTRIASE